MSPPVLPVTISGTIKPTHKAIKAYREVLDAYVAAQVDHEGAIAEIRKKIAKGYPLTNTIFEDTTRAFLSVAV